ncbi:MAG: hypothetical protein U1A78_31460 [Polyangia bacterium]
MMCRAQKRSRGLVPSLAPLLALSLGLVACAPEGATGDPPPDTQDDPPLTAFLGEPGCDPILPGFAYSQEPGGLPPACALPWPSNLYLREDPARKTGYTLTFGASSLPHNRQMIPIDPAAYTKRDGYGVGTPILLVIPGLDLTGFATEDHVERSLEKDAPLLLFEEAGGVIRRVPYFVERDALEDNASRQTLFVRPAEILKEATRYVVALRGLKDGAGKPIPPSPAFARLRDRKTAKIPVLRDRQARFDKTFALLEGQGIARDTVTLAWDFNTASSESMHGDLLAMRDDALRRVGPSGPLLTVEKITEYAKTNDGSGRPVDEFIAIELTGTFETPSYLQTVMIRDFEGSRIRRDAAGKPLAEGTRKPRFWVRIPHSALDGTPHGLVMYGHGLLGSGDQVRSGSNGRIANDHKLIFFSTDLFGMSDVDELPLINILAELGRFPSLTDRLHQGLVEWVLLARAMRERLADVPIVGLRKVQVNQAELFYSGISQGGIFGGSFLALTPDVTYGHLGVPGNNYNTLLQRSVDYNQFGPIVASAYDTPVNQNVALAVIQLLWDSTDPVSLLRHVTAEPFPGNRPHYVLLAPAKGDWQVAVVTNENAARSGLGIAVMEHYDRQRSVPLVKEQTYPHRGSGIVLYDYGNPWPALGNVPAMDPPGDPHGKPRKEPAHNRQMVTFFRTGEIIDVCGGDGCSPTIR